MKASLTFVLTMLGLFVSAAVSAQSATVIEFTQTGCQFLEAENGKNHGYSPGSKADCETINARDGDVRLASAKTIRLKPGKYVFRVTNKNVPYALGRDFCRRFSGISAHPWWSYQASGKPCYSRRMSMNIMDGNQQREES